MSDPSIKQLLARIGYTVERVEIDGNFRGVRILDPSGEPAHSTPYGSFDLGIEILKEHGILN